jgi:uncharacterized 2Fe-2S/4Fe-4S cluster protein (DUF4445 family)
MPGYILDFQPVGRRGQCQEGESVLDCARRLHIGIVSICGGAGTCGKCRVQVLEGPVSGQTSDETELLTPAELGEGWRLACQVYPEGNIRVHIPPESMTTPQRMQVEGLESEIPFDPPVRVYPVDVPVPTLSNQQADTERLLNALNLQHKLKCELIDFSVLKTLSARLRDWGSKLQAVVRGNEVIAISPLKTRHFGIAADLGSTKIAGYLIDIKNGQTAAKKGIMNPQISYGEDIISRIAAASGSPEKALELQSLVTKAIDEMAGDLCKEVGADKEAIVDSVVVGNTAMHHLFLNLPVKQLAMSPFVPAVSQALDVKAIELGLHFAGGSYVHMLPNIAMFVGADHVAALLATESYLKESPAIILDIGTNTEVSLVYDDKITAASCASGPALEGGHIKDGMRAAGGAIERVKIAGEKIEYQTIDDATPVGICGSGILDTLAQLLLAGIIDGSGRMKDGFRVRKGDKGREFVLVEAGERDGNPAIVFTQQDVRQLQLGKSAIRAGIQMLLEANNCPEERVKKVIIAGAFGSYIDVSSAITVGMLPDLPLERYRQVGNAAGMGARRALISGRERLKARAIADKVHHIELSTAPDFNSTFTEAMYLGKYRLKHGKREEIC